MSKGKNMLTMLSSYVLVKEIKANEQTVGGIYVPTTAKSDNLVKASVVSAGPGSYEGTTFVETAVKQGDVVLIDKSVSKEVKIQDEVYLVVFNSDILGCFDS